MEYQTPAAFRAAVEQRLLNDAAGGGRPVSRARKMLAFDRLLARLREQAPDGWVLKGGFALEVRLGDAARATRDIDVDWSMSLEDVTEAMLGAAARDLGDHFVFAVERVGEGPDRDGTRFHVDAYVAGRLFEQLAIDVGVLDALPGGAVNLEVPNLLAFAGVPATTVRATSLGRHLAEKLHAYTRSYGGGVSSRPKDLIDLVLIADLADFDALALHDEFVTLFAERDTHAVPTRVPAPPADWSRPYAALAAAVGLATDLAAGHGAAGTFLDPVLGGAVVDGVWDPRHRRWSPAPAEE